MEIIISDNEEEMSQYTADEVFHYINKNPQLLLCPATGATPIRTYQLLVEKMQENPQAFDQLRIIQLDEYYALPQEAPETFKNYLQHRLINPLNISSDRFISFRSNPQDPQEEIARIVEKLEELGQIDLCILGIGLNGHIAFNEPAKTLTEHCHIAELAETTKKQVRAEHEINHGITLGISDIMNSKKIILIVSGEEKKEAFQNFMLGIETAHFPASVLWKHPNLTIVCDRTVMPETPIHQTTLPSEEVAEKIKKVSKLI